MQRVGTPKDRQAVLGGGVLEPDTIVGPLQTSVQRRLDELSRSVENPAPDRVSDLVHRDIPLLVEALRSVLALHSPDTHGRCPICCSRGTRRLFRRRSRMPCRAYLAVQLRLGTLENPAGPP